MKRFWKTVTIEPREGGIGIALDGKPLRTPARAELLLPGEALAEAVAAEWRAVASVIDPRGMPVTGLANAAIDRVAPDPAAFAKGIAAYAESDLLCYRAEGPESLATRQRDLWDPILAWGEARYGVLLATVAGVMYRPQPPETVAALGKEVAAYDSFALAALQPLVTITGSVVIALAMAEGEIGRDQAWAAAQLDELWQEEQWGEDTLALEARAAKRKDFDAAARFLGLLG